jgi:hypothetical protein
MGAHWTLFRCSKPLLAQDAGPGADQFFDRNHGGSGASFNVELFEDMAEMNFDSLFAHSKKSRNIVIRLSLCDPKQNLGFA